MFKTINVEIYSYIESDDALGLGIKKIFSLVKTVSKCYLDWISGNDKFITDKFREDTTHVLIVLNKQEELNENQYVKYNGKYYQILLVDFPVQANQTEVLLKYVGEEL